MRNPVIYKISISKAGHNIVMSMKFWPRRRVLTCAGSESCQQQRQMCWEGGGEQNATDSFLHFRCQMDREPTICVCRVFLTL
jgi:hypothetical protein